MNAKTKNYLKLALKIVFTGAAMWLVYTRLDFSALQKLWVNANGWFFVPAVIAFIASQLVSSLRLLNFFRNIELPISFKANMRLYLLGMFYNLFLPGGIGGDGYKIVTLKRQYNTTHKEVFSAVFFDRLSGLWALFTLLILFTFSLPLLDQYAWWLLLLLIVGTLAYYLVLKYFFKRMIKRFVTTHLLAIGVQSLQLLAVSFILFALGIDQNQLLYFAIFLASSLASLVPISIGGLGAREVAIMWAANYMGLDKGVAVSVSLCFYFISMFTALSAVFLLFKKNNISGELKESP